MAAVWDGAVALAGPGGATRWSQGVVHGWQGGDERVAGGDAPQSGGDAKRHSRGGAPVAAMSRYSARRGE